MEENNKLKNKCRTCLDCSKGLQMLTKVIGEDREETKSYGELLKDLTNIDTLDEALNEMPQTICGCCIRKLKSAHAFVKQAHEVTDKLWSMINEKNDDDKPINCLQEAEIDIDECLQIKVEHDEETLQNKYQLSKLDNVELKKEEPDDAKSEVSSTSAKLAFLKKEEKESFPIEDGLEFNSVSEFEDDSNGEDKFDSDFKTIDDISESESESSNDSDWEEPKSKDAYVKSKTAEKSRIINQKNEDDDILTTCEEGDRVFSNASQLERYKRTHVPEELKVQCPFCTVKFGRRHNMYAHMRIHHKDKPLEEHIIQQRKLPRQYACEKCNATYTTKYVLLRHMKSKHDPNTKKNPERVKLPKKRFVCTICGRKFDSQHYLEVHIRRHTGEKPFKCDICDRAFYRPAEVKVHRRSHTGEKPFKCTICEKAFAKSNKLTEHMRTHSNERPYKCTECEKAFKQCKDLTIHRRTHTGERPYECGVCHRTFTQSNSFKVHQTKQKHFVVPNKQ